MSAKAGIARTEIAIPHGNVSDYFALTKPRVVLMVLVTTLAGYYLGVSQAGAGSAKDAVLALNLLIGTALAAGGTLALNQYFERDTDAMMDRTRNRPLPANRMRPAEALAFGAVAAVAGLAYLSIESNWLCAAVTAAITAVYLGVYTPMKRVSWMCNVVGAIPGALPPVAGWAAARGDIALVPVLLFAIMFLWQLPHTFAVARMFQADFARAGIHILPPDDERGRNRSNPVVICASIGLVAAGIVPALIGYAGVPYVVTASVLGIAMLLLSYAMIRTPGSVPAARRLLLGSLVYLPLVLLALVLNRV
ncbi:MAG TPA: heme o synthase [Candidatus Binataceae bacterium]|nr:heme o synthase [Candidatus Binataceae bacterium]